VTLVFSFTIIIPVTFISARLFPLGIPSTLPLIQVLTRVRPKGTCDRATDYAQSAFADHFAPQEGTGGARH
jgi:hypothetical protein